MNAGQDNSFSVLPDEKINLKALNTASEPITAKEKKSLCEFRACTYTPT